MGTIVVRKRNDGSNYYTAQIVRKDKGKVHREAQSFDRKQAANAWIVKREAELHKPGALENVGKDPKLADVIDRYIRESEKLIGKTKAQVLRTLKASELAELKCSQVGSEEVIAFLRSLDVTPQTRQNYLSHLSAIATIAKPAWGYPLDREAMRSAAVVAKRLGITAKSNERNRRPTLDELSKLMTHFNAVAGSCRSTIPMQRIIMFAIFSTRRQEEIVSIKWSDYKGNSVLVRNMKHPGDKANNNVTCELVPEASAIIEMMPRTDDRIFPFTADSISTAFTRACKVLGIENLHFHDLRHDGISRLFEMSRTIPQIASVSGHRSWQMLQRYTHLRHTGDKYADWSGWK